MISPAAYHLIPADWMKSKTFLEPWVWSASPVRAWYCGAVAGDRGEPRVEAQRDEPPLRPFVVHLLEDHRLGVRGGRSDRRRHNGGQDECEADEERQETTGSM